MNYWLAIDKGEQEFITIYREEPERDDDKGKWIGHSCGLLDRNEYPELYWEMEPLRIQVYGNESME